MREGVGKGTVRQNAFYFKRDVRNEQGKLENSINWWLDDDVVRFSHSQQRADSRPQFQFGLAEVNTEDLDKICSRPAYQGHLTHELQPIGDNLYHGNLLLSSDFDQDDMKTLAGYLAAVAQLRTREQDGFD